MCSSATGRNPNAFLWSDKILISISLRLFSLFPLFPPPNPFTPSTHRPQKNVYKETLPMDLLASLPRVKTVKRGQVKANLERLQKKFNEVSDENGNVQLEQFKMIMNCKNVS